MAFEHYIYSNGKKLRCGFTTGTCAALAASGAAQRLLTGRWPASVSLRTPKGLLVEVPLEDCRMEGPSAVCGAETMWIRPQAPWSRLRCHPLFSRAFPLRGGLVWGV